MWCVLKVDLSSEGHTFLSKARSLRNITPQWNLSPQWATPKREQPICWYHREWKPRTKIGFALRPPPASPCHRDFQARNIAPQPLLCEEVSVLHVASKCRWRVSLPFCLGCGRQEKGWCFLLWSLPSLWKLISYQLPSVCSNFHNSYNPFHPWKVTVPA